MLKQQEKDQVATLFKELILLINSNSGQKTNDNPQISNPTELSKAPIFHKRKSKINKLGREIKNVETVERSIVDLSEIKNLKRQSIQQERNQQIKEEQTKLKQQIFNDYNKVMTYKIHKEEKIQEQPKSKGKVFSIMQNLAITIQPLNIAPNS